MEKNFKIAVLIDGDNAQPKILKEILEEVAKYGKATIRRIYGDWTTHQMKGWKDIVNQHSFNPIQKFSYTKGKNSTDSAMIIDAMDILHERNVDGYCIVSSDSDYTGLAKRIREEGIFVMGIGRQTTPDAFIQSCEVFVFAETISGETETETAPEPIAVETTAKPSRPSASRKGAKSVPPSRPKKLQVDIRLINKAFEISAGEDEQVHISQMGLNLRKIDPSFDARSFGFKTLTNLFENLGGYEVIRKEANGITHSLLKKVGR
ncbi:MAG TPA: NYN domain-containing protein [Flavobacterium sp.]|nr:NYN domain-containing protein [Flavobacterium sp.]